jgi:hypothetical protein
VYDTLLKGLGAALKLLEVLSSYRDYCPFVASGLPFRILRLDLIAKGLNALGILAVESV